MQSFLNALFGSENNNSGQLIPNIIQILSKLY